MIRIFPSMIIIVLAYNYCVFFDPDFFVLDMFKIPLPSEALVGFTGADILILGALLLLCVEIMKAASSSPSTAIDHALSLLVFATCLVELVVLPQFGQPAFIFITTMTIIDVVAGFAISLSTARRDMRLE